MEETVKPSMKGATIARLVDDARKLLARSEPDRERLEAQLSSRTLALLDGKVEMSRWYPIEQYTELTELLWHEEGDGRIEYLRQRGEKVMKRLMEAGLYQQLDFLNRQDPGHPQRVTREDLRRACRLVGSISGTMRNFGRDSFEWDRDHPDRLLHHIRDATHFPEVMRFVAEGCESFLLRLIGPGEPVVTSDRPTPDHIVFTFDYSGLLEPQG